MRFFRVHKHDFNLAQGGRVKFERLARLADYEHGYVTIDHAIEVALEGPDIAICSDRVGLLFEVVGSPAVEILALINTIDLISVMHRIDNGSLEALDSSVLMLNLFLVRDVFDNRLFRQHLLYLPLQPVNFFDGPGDFIV